MCYPAEGVGDELTYMALLTDSKQLVPCGNVQPATDPLYPNLHECPFANTPTPTSTPSPFKVETVSEDVNEDEFGNLP